MTEGTHKRVSFNICLLNRNPRTLVTGVCTAAAAAAAALVCVVYLHGSVGALGLVAAVVVRLEPLDGITHDVDVGRCRFVLPATTHDTSCTPPQRLWEQLQAGQSPGSIPMSTHDD